MRLLHDGLDILDEGDAEDNVRNGTSSVSSSMASSRR